MLTDGECSVISCQIDVSSVDEVHRIILTGDWHYGSPLHATNRFNDDLKSWENSSNTSFILMGDMQEGHSTSERRAFKRFLSEAHESNVAAYSELALKEVNHLADKVSEAMQDRVLGVIGGNHYKYTRIYDGEAGVSKIVNCDRILADRLNAPFLGVGAFIKVNFSYQGSSVPFTFFCHHVGAGRGGTDAGSITGLKKMHEITAADAYVGGHNHRRTVDSSSTQVVPDFKGKVLNERKIWDIRSGSYLKGWVPGEQSYNADACRTPVDLGSASLEFKVVRRKDENGKRRLALKVRGVIGDEF